MAARAVGRVTWLGLTDHTGGRFAASGLGAQTRAPGSGPDLDRGTLMFETEIAGHVRPHDLLRYAHAFPEPRELAFRAIPGGGIALVHRAQDEITHAAIRWVNDGRAQTLRAYYSWDAPSGWARLALERPEGARITTSTVHAPRALALDDLRGLMLGTSRDLLSRDVHFAAVSDTIEPIGPTPSLHPHTPIAVPGGHKPAGRLQRGDTVVTDMGTIVPVLHTVHQRVPGRGSFAPVQLKAPYFGLARDILVGPQQHLVLRGSEVEYTFGQEAVLVPARHLVNGHAAIWAPETAVTDYVQLVLPGHEALLAAGCALESLYIGRIRRHPDRLDASVMAHIPSRELPEHARPIHTVLDPFEAITLIDQRAA